MSADAPAGGPPATASVPPAQGVARNAAAGLLMQLTTAAFTALLTLYLVRALGPEEYGLFAVAAGLGTLLIVPADAGITSSAVRFIAEHRDERGAAAAFFSDALRLKLLAAGLVAAGVAVGAEPIARAYGIPELVWPLRGAALALFGQALFILFRATFIALGRTSTALRLVASESAVETGTSVALVVLGTGAAGAAFGRASGYVCGAAVGILLAARALGGDAVRIGRRGSGRSRRIAGYAGPVVLIEGAFTLFTQVDVLVIGAVLGAASAGLFEAPLRIIAFLHYPGYALAMAVAPDAARRAREGEQQRPLAQAVRAMIIVQAALAAAVVAWATPIAQLVLGGEYGGSAEALRALAPFVFLSGFGPLLSLALTYMGEVRVRLPATIATVCLNLAIDVALVPRIGIVGASVGTSVAYALYIALHLQLCRRLLGLDLRPLRLALARALLAAAAMAAVLAAIGTTGVSALGWLLGATLGPAAFLLVLIMLGELSPTEIRRAAGSAARALARITRRRGARGDGHGSAR